VPASDISRAEQVRAGDERPKHVGAKDDLFLIENETINTPFSLNPFEFVFARICE
jgi:hypothetical protein